MTVAELIQRLSSEPGDRIVTIMREDFPHVINSIETETCTKANARHYYVCYYPQAEDEPTTEILVIR